MHSFNNHLIASLQSKSQLVTPIETWIENATSIYEPEITHHPILSGIDWTQLARLYGDEYYESLQSSMVWRGSLSANNDSRVIKDTGVAHSTISTNSSGDSPQVVSLRQDTFLQVPSNSLSLEDDPTNTFEFAYEQLLEKDAGGKDRYIGSLFSNDFETYNEPNHTEIESSSTALDYDAAGLILSHTKVIREQVTMSLPLKQECVAGDQLCANANETGAILQRKAAFQSCFLQPYCHGRNCCIGQNMGMKLSVFERMVVLVS